MLARVIRILWLANLCCLSMLRTISAICCGSFAFAENDLGVSLAERAMMIDLGEADVFEWQMFQAVHERSG